MEDTNQGSTTHSILIVDDDMFLLDMYAMRFRQDKWKVETAVSAHEALEKIHKGAMPEVLLLDVVMPEVDGFELLEQINTEKLAPGSLKIYLSNLGLEEDLVRAKSLGADSYIVKASATPTEVVAHVLDVINKNHEKSHGL